MSDITSHASHGRTAPGTGAVLSQNRPDLSCPAEYDHEPKSNTPVQISVRGLKKNYQRGSNVIPVLRGVDLDIREGEFVAIVGQSGCGKSTLLHLLGTLDQPDAGEIIFSDQRIDNLAARKRDRLRNDTFGLIFQFYHLLPELTAEANVLLPLMIGQGFFGYLSKRWAFRRRAAELLEKVHLSHRRKHKPRELSGGEMQRVAIARALVNGPQVLLADEPTGNLDRAAGQEIFEILRNLNATENLTIVMVTHDEKLAEQADRTVRLVEGRIE
ncbi:MAG: ABC transporter ATP-binding protein [Planctomycetota bacterium]|nr:ABC transporter ATP-binding protein [Planctomycetota bacterium]